MLTLRHVQDPVRRDSFHFAEFGSNLPSDTTLLHIKTESNSCYEVWVVSGSAKDVLVVVRCRYYAELMVPRVAEYFHRAGEGLSPHQSFESGIGMVFRYAMPDGSWIEHRSGLIIPGGIAVVLASDMQPFRDAVRIFREAALPSDELDREDQELWSCLVASLSEQKSVEIKNRVRSFHPGAQRVLHELFQVASDRGTIASMAQVFEVLFAQYWSTQPIGMRGAMSGTSSDMAAFNKLREIAGVSVAVSVRGELSSQ